MYLTIDEKNDLNRLDRIKDICEEATDRAGVISFEEIWQEQSNARRALKIEIGQRIINNENIPD